MAGPGPGKAFVRNAGSWSSELEPGTIFVRDGGAWKEVKSILVRQAAGWSIIWNEFIGSLRPDADVETSDWTPTPLYAELDEVSPDDATTEVTSSIFNDDASTQTYDFEVALSNPLRPTERETVVFRVRQWLEVLVGAVTTNNVTMELKQGSTVKATISQSGPFPGGYVTKTKTLSQAEKDSITDWDDLRVRVSFEVQVTNSGDSAEAHVTWIELEFSTA